MVQPTPLMEAITSPMKLKSSCMKFPKVALWCANQSMFYIIYVKPHIIIFRCCFVLITYFIQSPISFQQSYFGIFKTEHNKKAGILSMFLNYQFEQNFLSIKQLCRLSSHQQYLFHIRVKYRQSYNSFSNHIYLYYSSHCQ